MMPPRKQTTLLDIYRERNFELTRDQVRTLVRLLRLTEDRPARSQPAKPDAA